MPRKRLLRVLLVIATVALLALTGVERRNAQCILDRVLDLYSIVEPLLGM